VQRHGVGQRAVAVENQSLDVCGQHRIQESESRSQNFCRVSLKQFADF
jgi:hypothetical protein